MTGAASLAAVLLAVVFGWAAVAKAARHRLTVAAFSELGLPAPRMLALAVPAAEAVIAAVLLARPAVGAALALGALAAFTLVVVRAVSGGATGGCGCFGSRRVAPVGPPDVVRNGLLAALAAVATGTARLVPPGVAAILAVAGALIVGAGVQVAASRRLGRHAPLRSHPTADGPGGATA